MLHPGICFVLQFPFGGFTTQHWMQTMHIIFPGFPGKHPSQSRFFIRRTCRWCAKRCIYRLASVHQVWMQKPSIKHMKIKMGTPVSVTSSYLWGSEEMKINHNMSRCLWVTYLATISHFPYMQKVNNHVCIYLPIWHGFVEHKWKLRDSSVCVLNLSIITTEMWGWPFPRCWMV